MAEGTGILPGLPAVAGKPVHVGFDGGRLTSDAGILLLSAVEQRLGFRMPAWREHSPRCRVQRAGVRKSPKNEPAGQRRAAGRLWGFGHAAVLAEDHFAPIGESWSRR